MKSLSMILLLLTSVWSQAQDVVSLDLKIQERVSLPAADFRFFPSLGPDRAPILTLKRAMPEGLSELREAIIDTLLSIDNPIISIEPTALELFFDTSFAEKLFGYKGGIPAESKVWEYYNRNINLKKPHEITVVFDNFRLETLDKVALVKHGENGDFRRQCVSGYVFKFDMTIMDVQADDLEFNRLKAKQSIRQEYSLTSPMGYVETHDFKVCQ